MIKAKSIGFPMLFAFIGIFYFYKTFVTYYALNNNLIIV